MEKNRCVILFIDQAVSFGGSLVVLGALVGSLDRGRFKPVVITEVQNELAGHYIGGDVVKLRVNHVMNYHDREIIKKKISKSNLLPGFFKKIILRLVVLADLFLNSIYILRIARIIRRYSVDIVHMNNGFGNTEAILASRLTGTRVLIHLHGFGKIYKMTSRLIPNISRFIAISYFIKNSAVNNGIPENMVEVVHNPVIPHPVEKYKIDELKKRYGLKDDDWIFGIVGRVIPWKGQLEFLKAAKHVLRQFPNAKAVIVGDKSDGDADYYNHIKDFVRQEGIEERVVFTGYIQDIHPVYEILDVLVHTSIEPEPFGLVITEALSHETPVICSDLGAPKELIKDGIDGFIVDPFNESLLADRIKELLQNKGLRRKMGKAGKDRIMNEFNIDKFIHEFEAVYDRIGCNINNQHVE